MIRKYLLSTGVFFRCSQDINESIKYASQFDVDGVELGILSFDELNAISLNDESLEVLKKFNYNTIHAPGSSEMKWKNTKFFQEAIIKLKELARQANCNKITIHINHIEDFDFIMSTLSEFEVCIENVRPTRDNENNLLILLERYPFCVTFDVAHAMELSIDDYKNLFKKCKNRIKLVHLSLTYNKRFHNFVSKW